MKKVMARIEKEQIESIDGKVTEYIDLICGDCDSILYGFDEEICPVCGSLNDFSNCPDTLY